MSFPFPTPLRAAFALIGTIALTGMSTAAEPKKDARPANRLAKESSPYLLQHAHNPVDWYPWGAAAFEKATKEKKLIFLSIGYSSCHWCHVMERESFEDAGVAAILNEHFVCIKVDREERPDIDEIYMTALGVIGARGGWPMSMFLTEDGKPVVGGTYWPKEDRTVDGETARGFKSILAVILDLRKTKEKELRAQAAEVASRTEDALTRVARMTAIVDLNRALASGPAEALKDDLDPEYGGIGNAARRHRGTKFPMPPALTALLRQSRRDKDKDLAGLVTLTLEKMAAGGIYDQVGGGFHRYSTERTWTVPHFEKMLYDNAQMVELYSEAYRTDPKPTYRRVVAETIGFLRREMTAPAGGFYSALDADSDGKEGEFYVWTGAEIEKALGNMADAMIFRAAYSVSGAPTFEENAYVLKITRPLAEIAKDQKLTEEELGHRLIDLKAKVLKARDLRKRPFLDTKIITAWNGQMIAGLAAAGQTFQEPAYTAAAVKAAEFVLKNLRTKDGRLLRTYGTKADGTSAATLNAYLDDYAHLTHGLLELHEATADARWLAEALALTDTMVKWHGEADRGGFFYTSSDHEKLFARPKDYHDGVQPAGNSVASQNLVSLWQKTGDQKYRVLAEKSLKQFAGVLKATPAAVPAMAEALHAYLDASAAKPKESPKKDAAPAVLPKNSADAVTATAKIGDADKDGQQTITLTIAPLKPWHLYANPVAHDDLEGARTTVDVYADGKKLAAKVTYPKGTVEKDDRGATYRVYEGEVTIAAIIARAKDDVSPLELRVKVQACTSGEDGRCLLPATLKVPVK